MTGSLGLGGYLNSRRPISLGREAVRSRGEEYDTVIVPFGGLETDLVASNPRIRRLLYGTVSLGVFGLCPTVRRRVESGDLTPVEFGATSILRALQSGARREEAFAMHWITDRTAAIPAARPDVCLIHVPFASPNDHTAWGYGTGVDLILAAASTRTIVSYDIATDRPPRLPNMFVLPPHLIAELVHRPFGAAPTGCFPLYGPNPSFFADYVRDEVGRRAGRPVGRESIAELSDAQFLATMASDDLDRCLALAHGTSDDAPTHTALLRSWAA